MMKPLRSLIFAGFLGLLALMITTSSAAGATALCADVSNPCENPITSLHVILTAGTVGVLHGLSPLVNVLCLNALADGEVLGLGTPQEVHLSALNFTNCGTNATHSNCEIISLELRILVDILSAGGGIGSATGLNGETLVNCSIPLIGKIDCVYEGQAQLGYSVKSAGGTDGHGMLNAENTPLLKSTGSGFCSAESTITSGLLEPLTDTYISS